MNRVDDLGAVDPLQINGRNPEVGVPELALDDHQRDTLMRRLDQTGSDARSWLYSEKQLAT